MARRKRVISDGGAMPRKHARSLQSTPSVITRGAKRRSVYPAVFLTTELLENILSHLPMKDILMAQRVCKKWRAVITSNKELQQALFFAPIEPSIYWKYEGGNGDLSKERLTKIASTEMPAAEHSAYFLRSATPNPLLFRSGRARDPILDRADDRTDHAVGFMRPSSRHMEGSRRKMLVTQPPIKDVDVAVVRITERKFPKARGGTIKESYDSIYGVGNSTGVTVWDIMKPVIEAENNNEDIIWGSLEVIADELLFPSEAEMAIEVVEEVW